MNRRASDAGLSRLSGLLESQLGLHFGPERCADLERGIASAAGEFGFQDVESCITWLASAPLSKQQIGVLARHLTVGETYFFRDTSSFAALEQQVLPALIRARQDTTRQLRFWSAGCCTGEEAYSLAVLLTRLLPDWRDWQISILATDLNVQFLEAAETGDFTEWSFRDSPPWLKAEYFRPSGNGRYQILPALQRLVTFGYLNLAQDVYPSLFNHTNAMDLILCRNVLMYFSPEQAQRVVTQLTHCLLDDGWLLGSAAESLYFPAGRLTPVNFPGVTFYHKVGVPAIIQADHAATTRLAAAKRVNAASEERRMGSGRDAAPPAPQSIPAGDEDFARAQRWYAQGRYAEAAAGLQRHLAKHPDAGAAILLMARVYADQGQLEEALRWSDRAIAADKLQAAAHYLRATILQEQDLVLEAVQGLNRALYLDPRFILAHVASGSLAHKQGQAQLAERHFRQALALLAASPDDELVPESEGVTAARLREIILTMTKSRIPSCL